MKIEFDITEDDLIEFYVFHAKNDEAIGKAKKRIGVFYPIMFFVLASSFLFLSNPQYFIIFLFYLLGILCIIVSKTMIGSGYRNRIKRMFNKYDNSGLIGKQIVTLEDELIVAQNEYSTSNTSWNGIKAMEENEKFYFLYLNSINAIVIPKDAVEDLYQFENFVSERI